MFVAVVCVRVYIFVCMCVCIYMCVCVSVFVCMYVYIHARARALFFRLESMLLSLHMYKYRVGRSNLACEQSGRWCTHPAGGCVWAWWSVGVPLSPQAGPDPPLLWFRYRSCAESENVQITDLRSERKHVQRRSSLRHGLLVSRGAQQRRGGRTWRL